MNSFNLIKLDDLVKRVKVGFVGSINDFYCEEEYGVPLIRTTDLNELGINYTNLKFVTKEFHKKNKKSQIKKGDVLIARHGDNGKANVFKEDFDAQVLNAVIIEPNQDLLDSNLIKIFFDSPFIKKQILGVIKGSVQGVINTSHIANLLVPLSKEIDYKHVSKIITSLDSKIELNNGINTELESMAKTLYDYWFLQFDFPDKDGKPFKTSGGKMVWNEELKRDIPDGWNVDILKNHISIERGISYKGTDIKDKGIPMVNLNSFYLDGRYKDEGIKYFAGSVNENKVIHTGDLMIATTDVTRNAYIIGKSFILPDLYSGQIVASCDIAKVNIGDKLDKYFLDMLFNSDNYHRYIKGFASGTLVLHLDTKGVDWYKCLIPPKDLLNKYAKFKLNIDAKKTLTLKENKQLAQLRDWLLPMLMNGQVKVM